MLSLLFFIIILSQLPLGHSSILTDYGMCKLDGFARTSLVCDADNVLANQTKAKLSSLLLGLQSRVLCNCEVGCIRADGNDRYIGLLIITNKKKVNDAQQPLNESMKYIFEDAELGNEQCNNGLLLAYIKDEKQLASYQGTNSYILLTPRELQKLHELSSSGLLLGDDTMGIQYLLANYGIPISAEIERAEAWTPIFGLFLALLIILSILVLLLVLFMARFCCCCARSNKDQYIVTPIPKYKTMEPLFISTPALTEPFYGAHFDAIYSTPYSGTPLPPPHFPRLEIHPARSASISQTATPVSTHRHRIRPFPHTQITRSFSPSETPLPSSRQEISKVDDSTQTNATSIIQEKSKRSDSRSDEPSTSLPVAPDVASLQRSIGYAESDLSFLDPRRKLEVQTRTDFFY